jgi:Flp pilus assembly protein TadG
MPTSQPGRSISRGSSRGIAMLELLLVLPVLIMLVMATAELGRAFMQYNTLNKAVRDGARHLANTALLGSTGTVQLDAAKLTETRNLVVFGNIQGDSDPLLPGLEPAAVTITAAPLASVSVTAAYQYAPIFARLPSFAAGPDVTPSFTLRAGVIMRAL